jgi:3,4-dihydroxy 2-butanone 4-phosphate synthase/GTP cyclohydrolase II
MSESKTDFSDAISSIEEIIEDARNGRMFILVDHEDRENEGDLVIPAQMCTPSAINFMATHGRGLICLALPGARIDALGLPLMSPKNSSRHETAFTLSIEAREGVTTGISAADRARTVSVAIDPTKGAADIATPGHIFPLKARDGGVLVRAGHTEAAVDVSRLAGLNPSGVICEIMNDDGTMARLPDLVSFAQRHGLKIGTISDLIAYRRRHDNLVNEKAVKAVQSVHGGDWLMRIFADETQGAERGCPAARHDDEDGGGGRAFAPDAAAIRAGGADPFGAGSFEDHAGDEFRRAEGGGS